MSIGKEEKGWLDKSLLEYSKSGIYPFHMPGAKCKNIGLGDPFLYDITEIDGFDDLRNANGILKELQSAWASLYGAGRAYLSVNGSTCSNLAVIFAATRRHETVFAAEDCHPSVWNALRLQGITAVKIPGRRLLEGNLEPSSPEEIERLILEGRTPSAIVVTSPTYEGIKADISGISRIARSQGAALIVDSAHGAHFGKGMNRGFLNPIEEGADAAVVSLHKTLPVLGQLSLILLPERENNYIDENRVKEYLNIFQTSSPSYLLMSSASLGCRYILEKGEEKFAELKENLDRFYSRTADLKNIHIVDRDDKDRSKIIISTVGTCLSGEKLMSGLREGYALELEKCGSNYALALSSVMDEAEGFERLSAALHEMDSEI